MTKFEQMLLDKGYNRYILNLKTMMFEEANGYFISSIANIGYHYFHKTDMNILNKIGKCELLKNYTNDDRKGEICFGLHEQGKPTTLISPRPRIEIKRIKNQKVVIEDETFDNSMNVVLDKVSCDEIFKAMYDKSIIIKLDLTLNETY